jgi:hypothetical protein
MTYASLVLEKINLFFYKNTVFTPFTGLWFIWNIRPIEKVIRFESFHNQRKGVENG